MDLLSIASLTELLTLFLAMFTGGNRAKLPSSRWHRRGRLIQEVFRQLLPLCNRRYLSNLQQRNMGTWYTLLQNDIFVLSSFLYNNIWKIRRETTVGKTWDDSA